MSLKRFIKIVRQAEIDVQPDGTDVEFANSPDELINNMIRTEKNPRKIVRFIASSEFQAALNERLLKIVENWECHLRNTVFHPQTGHRLCNEYELLIYYMHLEEVESFVEWQQLYLNKEASTTILFDLMTRFANKDKNLLLDQIPNLMLAFNCLFDGGLFDDFGGIEIELNKTKLLDNILMKLKKLVDRDFLCKIKKFLYLNVSTKKSLSILNNRKRRIRQIEKAGRKKIEKKADSLDLAEMAFQNLVEPSNN